MGKKIIFLFVALLLPGCIFVFLKVFGKNEFAVEPLFQQERPVVSAECGDVKIPYTISTDVLGGLFQSSDTLAVVYFKNAGGASENQLKNIRAYMATEPVSFNEKDIDSPEGKMSYACTFLMTSPNDVVLVDRTGLIRGQYDLSNLDETDRLKTEITIILKHY